MNTNRINIVPNIFIIKPVNFLISLICLISCLTVNIYKSINYFAHTNIIFTSVAHKNFIQFFLLFDFI